MLHDDERSRSGRRDSPESRPARGPAPAGGFPAARPPWCVGVYLGEAALAPVTLHRHRRHGAAVPVQLLSGVVGAGVARATSGVPYVAFVIAAFVRVFGHRPGRRYADGSLPRGGRRSAPCLVAAGR